MRNGLQNPLPRARPLKTLVKDRPGVRIIPYDYVAKFKLNGEVGRLVEDVINISAEGTFIGLAVGYGLASGGISQVSFIPLDGQNIENLKLKDLTLANIPPHVLMDGFRLNPALENLAFKNGAIDTELPVSFVNEQGLFQSIRQGNNVNFLFNIIDTGSGRELQNEPVHNIAALGKANGERPFRMLARPLAFMPQSTVRIQIEERSADVQGDLYIVIHGYKILGAAGVAEEHIRVIYQKARQQFGPLAASSKTIQRLEQKTVPSTRMIPFDYVSTLDIEGKEGNIVEDEININVEGGFVATAMSYSIDIPEVAVPIHLTGNEPRVDLNTIKLTDISSIVLKDGFRVRPDFRRLAFGNGALTSQSRETVRVIFERLNLPENTSFLYKIIDTGTGRDWQNEFEYNIAGLGIANGDRPFRNLAWPMHFLPRSTIRIEVKEIFGRGRLFIVFQGYKMLGKK